MRPAPDAQDRTQGSARDSGSPGGSMLLLLLVLAFGGMAVFARSRAGLEGFVACAFAAGGLLLLLWRYGAFSLRQVLVWAVLFRLFFLWIPPSLSDDAYRYVWDGLLQVRGINPYLFVPEAPALSGFQDEPIFGGLNSSGFYSVYPPLSQLVFAVGGLFYDLDWQASYYVIKLILACFEVAGLFLLSRMADARRLMLYAWNPLVVVEAAGQAHTDAAVVCFLVLTLWLARKEKPRWASAALACAGWVKLYPFFFFPFLWRRYGWRAVWPAAAVSLALILPYAHPEAPGHVAASLDLYVRYFEFNAGPYYGLKRFLYFFTGIDWSKTLGPALRMVFISSMFLLYVLDRRWNWSLRRAFVCATGLFILLATTVHPWYLLGLLPLLAPAARPSWHWYWLGLFSLGTYLLYADLPHADGAYWTFVNLGWAGFFALAGVRYQDEILQWIQRRRAAGKLRTVLPFLPERPGPLRVLDLGAGEGYVGAALQAETGAEVVLADVAEMNRTPLPHVLYDGRRLPFPDGSFDVTILCFVLHHCEDQAAVVREALRVAGDRVVVVESVYRGRFSHRLLTVLDKLANRWRSAGRMQAQEAHLHFRTAAGWRSFFQAAGAVVRQQKAFGSFWHRQVLYVLQPGQLQ